MTLFLRVRALNGNAQLWAVRKLNLTLWHFSRSHPVLVLYGVFERARQVTVFRSHFAGDRAVLCRKYLNAFGMRNESCFLRRRGLTCIFDVTLVVVVPQSAVGLLSVFHFRESTLFFRSQQELLFDTCVVLFHLVSVENLGQLHPIHRVRVEAQVHRSVGKFARKENSLDQLFQGFDVEGPDLSVLEFEHLVAELAQLMLVLQSVHQASQALHFVRLV